MTVIPPPPDRTAFSTRSAQPYARARALDTSIERELRRGAMMHSVVRPHHWALLDALVEHELQHGAPATEASLLAVAPLFGAFRNIRYRRRLTWLLRAGLARRERATLRPTVAGIEAVRSGGLMPASLRPPQGLLRALRRGEIGSV